MACDRGFDTSKIGSNMKAAVLFGLLALVLVPSAACSTYPVFVVNQEGLPVFLNEQLSIYYWQQLDGSQKLVGETDGVFFNNNAGSMTLFDRFSLSDITYAEFITSSSGLVPQGEKVKVYTQGEAVYIQIHSSYTYDQAIEGAGFWARLTTGNIDAMVKELKETLAPKLEEANSSVTKTFIPTTHLISYFVANPASIIKIFYTPIPVKNPFMFLIGWKVPMVGTEFWNIPNVAGYLVIGLIVSFAAYFDIVKLLVDPQRRAQLLTEIFGFAALAMFLYCGAYFMLSYYSDSATALNVAIGLVLFAAVGEVVYARVLSRDAPRSIIIIFARLIWKIIKLIFKALKLAIKGPAKVAVYPFRKVNNYGSDVREESKMIKKMESYNMDKELRNALSPKEPPQNPKRIKIER